MDLINFQRHFTLKIEKIIFLFLIGIITGNLAITDNANDPAVVNSNDVQNENVAFEENNVSTIDETTQAPVVNSEDKGRNEIENEIPAKPSAVEMVASGERNFSAIFFKHTCYNYDGNYVISPLSIYMILSMASYGAKVQTRADLYKILGIPKSESHFIKDGYKLLLNDLANYNPIDLSVENKFFYYPNSNRPKKKYSDTMKNIFGKTDDYLNDVISEYDRMRVIGQWELVNGYHADKHIVGLTDFGLDPVVLLDSSLFFNGSWVTPFDPNTEERDFMKNGVSSIKISTMHTFGKFRYGELPRFDATFIELPYKSDDPDHVVSMFIILPKRKNGLKDLEQSIHLISLDKLCDSGREEQIHVWLPKFSFDSTAPIRRDLKDLKDVGLAAVLSPQGNFSRVSESIRITPRGVGHYAMVDVHQNGTGPVKKNKELNDSQSATVSPSDGEYPNGRMFQAMHPFIGIIATRGKIRLNLLTFHFTEPPVNYKS